MPLPIEKLDLVIALDTSERAGDFFYGDSTFAMSSYQILNELRPALEAAGTRAGILTFRRGEDEDDATTAAARQYAPIQADIAATLATVGYPPGTDAAAGNANMAAAVRLARRMLRARAHAPVWNASAKPAIIVYANTDLTEAQQTAAAVEIRALKEVLPHVRLCLIYSAGSGTNRLQSWFTALFEIFWYAASPASLERFSRAFLLKPVVPIPYVRAKGFRLAESSYIALTANPAPE